MGSAKAVSLSVRSYRVSHLCFEVDGILEISNAQLGVSLKGFDFPRFYDTVRGFDPMTGLTVTPTLTGDPSRLRYDTREIDKATTGVTLATIRKEARKVALDNAVNARQNAYFAKYANKTAIIDKMNEYYSPSAKNNDSKIHRLERLASIATSQGNQLIAAYEHDKEMGVVKNTESTLRSDTTSYGYSATSGVSFGNLASSEVPENLNPSPPNPPPPWSVPKWPPYQGSELPPEPRPPQAVSDFWPAGFAGNIGENRTFQNIASYQEQSNSAKARQDQVIVNSDYVYRVPYLEAHAQKERALISLNDQQFAQFMYTQNLPNLDTVFKNELNSIDSNIYRLQIAYLNAILMSPIDGIITGVYKNPGDAVKAGEPVIRVEDNSSIYLMATVVYRGPIVIGSPASAPPIPNSTVTVNTNLFDASPLSPPLTGTVVSARGHRDDDRWDLMVLCSNLVPPSSSPVLPFGYHFDYDNTTVTIT
jgi:hypothetical protein